MKGFLDEASLGPFWMRALLSLFGASFGAEVGAAKILQGLETKKAP